MISIMTALDPGAPHGLQGEALSAALAFALAILEVLGGCASHTAPVGLPLPMARVSAPPGVCVSLGSCECEALVFC